MKKATFIALILALCILCGCNSANVNMPESSDTEISVNRENTDIKANIPVEKLALSAPGTAEISDFGLNLFKACCKKGENTLISPLSVLIALSMTANGAEGDTLIQMENLLGMPSAELNDYIKEYMEALPEAEKYKLSAANSIWVKNGFPVNESFLQSSRNYYKADIYEKPFDESTANEINSWAKEKTNGMIPKIIDSIPNGTIMYLINAIAFDAQWEEMYGKERVREEEFTAQNGEIENVFLMYSTENDFLEDENATGFIKYYYGRKYAFAALLPNEGVDIYNYVQSLDGAKLQSILANPKDMYVTAAIPKFENKFDIELSDVLKTLGMTNAFIADTADFSGISESPIYISGVQHSAFISVSESGTKAGAVTSATLSNTGIAPEKERRTVILNRPFVYMLIDCETNTPLFIGVQFTTK